MANVTSNPAMEYALGYTNAEHERLTRQAALIAPITERLLREAGIGPGQRVLDLGSGLGDVSMAVAKLVGPSGEVVGIERDNRSVTLAETRIKAAGFHNVKFLQADLHDIPADKPFDAAVGRFILMFLPDPSSVLRSVSRLVSPGGVLAFQEPSWISMLAMAARLPLWSRALAAIHETFLRSGVNPEMGLDLHRTFREIGLAALNMHLDMPLGADASFTSIMSDLLCSVRPLAEQHRVPLAELGDFSTLSRRIQAEIAAANTVVSVVPIVSVWSRKPDGR
jgi:2-polyprenyl-3-methyl-5-hydroxy-6-metoxy-1,4-benzoquinol methylase